MTNISSIDIRVSMPVDLELAPKQKRPAGQPCCEPVVYPDVARREAEGMARVAKALGDPIRLQLVVQEIWHSANNSHAGGTTQYEAA